MAGEEEKKHSRGRRYDNGFDNVEPPKLDPNMTGVIGQMLGGIGSGLGQAFAQKLNERLILVAAALAGQLANPSNSGNLDVEANDAVNYADAAIKRMEAHDPGMSPLEEELTPEEIKQELQFGRRLTDFEDAVQRLTESCDSFAERLKGHEREFFMARIEAVREAGKAFRR